MTDAVLNRGTDFRILSLFNGFKLPDFEKITEKMFERLVIPRAINYIGDMNKSDALY